MREQTYFVIVRDVFFIFSKLGNLKTGDNFFIYFIYLYLLLSCRKKRNDEETKGNIKNVCQTVTINISLSLFFVKLHFLRTF